jgi:hypothetical protein
MPGVALAETHGDIGRHRDIHSFGVVEIEIVHDGGIFIGA